MIFSTPTPKFEQSLKPLQNKDIVPFKIITFDTEDDSCGNPEMGDFYDGQTHWTYDLRTEEGRKDMINFFYRNEEQAIFVAHNLEYDINNVFRDAGYIHIKSMIYVQRLIKAELLDCPHIMWDSYNWYSAPLAKLAEVVGSI